jgi:hypothetical protein
MRGVQLFVFWLFPLLLSADFLHWQGDYASAHALAQKSGKPLLVFVAKAGDDKTNEVLRTVFMNRPYIQKLQNSTLPVMVTYEERASYPIEMYYTTMLPALFLVDSRTELFLASPLYGKEITVAKLQQITREYGISK